ncbi:MAG: hypothetical protein M3N32_06595 [Actinomycetota bacterium]|nr:hypothetical protein [Actinomycetota bacterium]
MDGPGRCSCRHLAAKVAKDGMHLLVRAPMREYDRTGALFNARRARVAEL